MRKAGINEELFPCSGTPGSIWDIICSLRSFPCFTKNLWMFFSYGFPALLPGGGHPPPAGAMLCLLLQDCGFSYHEMQVVVPTGCKLVGNVSPMPAPFTPL